MPNSVPLTVVTMALGLAGSVATQAPTVVSPAAVLTTNPDSNNSYPFSLVSLTYQQVHSASSFSVAGPRTVQSLRFRTQNIVSTAASVDLLLRMADCPHDSEQAQSTFANNTVASSDTLVFTRKTVNLPTPTTLGWDLTFPLDQPFSWAGGHLSWFCEVFANSNGGANLGRYYAAFGQTGETIYSAALGCASALGTAPPEHHNRIEAPGGDATFRGFSYVPSGGLPAVLMLGLTPTAIDLTPIGGTGCTLTTDILGLTYTSTASGPNGEAVITLPLPATPLLTGATFESQFAFVQAGANPLAIFLSRGVTNHIGRNHGVTRIFGGGGASQGSLDLRYALVLGLD